MKRENPSGSISMDIRPGQSARTTQNWLFTRTLNKLLPGFNHLQSYGARVLFTAVTVLICACTQAPSLQNHFGQTDSLIIHINGTLPYRHLDLFVYSDTLTHALELHIRCGDTRTIRMKSSSGGKIVAAIADLQGEFSESALPDRFETMENICMHYADENPDAPMQSGYCHAYTGKRTELDISPLLCPIVIKSIRIEGDAPLENPVLQLTDVNEKALILQNDGFHPASVLKGPEGLGYPFMMLRELTYDIGSSPRETDVTLWCYPNEDGTGPGGPCTSLLVSGNCRTEKRQFRIPLGAISRGAKICMDIELKSSNYD